MRKITIFLAILAIAAPSVAYAKSKKPKTVVTTPTDPNASTRKLLWDGMMLVWVPFQPLMPKK